MKLRSPIEMMVDKACGFDPNAPRPAEAPQVLLRCPKCKRTKRVEADKSDPPKTSTILLQCPDCFVEGEFESMVYLDKHGKEITS